MSWKIDEYLISRGDVRLNNWGDWCAGDTSKKLGYPSRVPYAVLYEPEAGDIWEASIDPPVRDPDVDEYQAMRVEEAVLRLNDSVRYLAMLAYIRKFPLGPARRGVPTLVRYTGMNRHEVQDTMARLQSHIGGLVF